MLQPAPLLLLLLLLLLLGATTTANALAVRGYSTGGYHLSFLHAMESWSNEASVCHQQAHVFGSPVKFKVPASLSLLSSSKSSSPSGAGEAGAGAGAELGAEKAVGGGAGAAGAAEAEKAAARAEAGACSAAGRRRPTESGYWRRFAEAACRGASEKQELGALLSQASVEEEQAIAGVVWRRMRHGLSLSTTRVLGPRRKSEGR